LRDEISFDPPLFVTEWLKISMEVLLITFIIRTLTIMRDVQINKKQDYNYIHDNFLFYLVECSNNLNELMNDNSKIEILGKRAYLCWQEAQTFLEKKEYWEVNNKNIGLHIFYYHNVLIEKNSIKTINESFTAYRFLDSSKIRYINTLIKDININTLNIITDADQQD
jgi:hypothetical protein